MIASLHKYVKDSHRDDTDFEFDGQEFLGSFREFNKLKYIRVNFDVFAVGGIGDCGRPSDGEEVYDVFTSDGS